MKMLLQRSSVFYRQLIRTCRTNFVVIKESGCKFDHTFDSILGGLKKFPTLGPSKNCFHEGGHIKEFVSVEIA
jgi:hypothetical protein